MKKFLLVGVIGLFAMKVSAQTEEVQQLLLNVEKLAQLKQILNDMHKGYEIISSGYTAIKNISEGNLSLHKEYLDKLLAVSPVIKNYAKVGEIIRLQLKIVSEYKNAFKCFKSDNNFAPSEIQYLENVYKNVVGQSLKNIDRLIAIITPNNYRMSDDDRLKIVDELFDDMQDKFTFLKVFNSNTTILAIQRAKEKNDITTIQHLYGLTP